MTEFHHSRLNKVRTLTLSKLTNKNPYLFRAKNFSNAADLVTDMMAAFISSSDEKFFGDFLENLASFVAGETLGGIKPGTTGVDLQYTENGIVYVISIKSGISWGNSSQHKRLAQDLRTASNVIRQSRHTSNVETVLGICYGKTRTSRHSEGYLKVVGQNFWKTISGEIDFYKHIMHRVGFTADQFSSTYRIARESKTTQLIDTFCNLYCNSFGAINWERLIIANSENYTSESSETNIFEERPPDN
jgi:hypothetical protein